MTVQRGIRDPRWALEKPPSKRGARSAGWGRARLVPAVAVLFLSALSACDHRGGELATGVPSGPTRNVIPTSNTSTLEVRITNPDGGATVSGTVAIEVAAKERDVQRARTDLFIGEALVTSSTVERFAYAWNTSGYSGTQRITAVGWDAQGNSALAAISVTVASSSTAPPPPSERTVASVAISPDTVTAGQTSTGTVVLDGAAPAGGAAVSLVSDKSTVATVPSSVTVPEGGRTATFTVSSHPVATPDGAAISANAGGVTRTATLWVVPAGVTMGSLSLSPTLVASGGTSQGTVTLSGPAPDGGASVELSSGNNAVATVPPSVAVPAGATTAAFTITTLVNNTGVGQFAEISGQAGGVTRSATITTVPPPSGPAASSVGLFPSSVGGGGPVTGIVTFDAPLTDGVILSFSSSHPDIVQVPPEGVQVIWSSTQRAFPVSTSRVSANTVVTITATACCGGVGQATGTLTVSTDPPPPPDRVEVKDARWIPGGRGGTLEVRATSTSETALLTVYMVRIPDRFLMVLSPVGGGRYEGRQSFGGGMTNPEQIEVRSSLGGAATSQVRQ
jgi:hypothetical protein